MGIWRQFHRCVVCLWLGNLPEFRFRRLALYLRIARECGDIGTYRVGLADDRVAQLCSNWHMRYWSSRPKPSKNRLCCGFWRGQCWAMGC